MSDSLFGETTRLFVLENQVKPEERLFVEYYIERSDSLQMYFFCEVLLFSLLYYPHHYAENPFTPSPSFVHAACKVKELLHYLFTFSFTEIRNLKKG